MVAFFHVRLDVIFGILNKAQDQDILYTVDKINLVVCGLIS